jgi:hypothetical protein
MFGSRWGRGVSEWKGRWRETRTGTELAGAFLTAEMVVLLLKKGVPPMNAWTKEDVLLVLWELEGEGGRWEQELRKNLAFVPWAAERKESGRRRRMERREWVSILSVG